MSPEIQRNGAVTPTEIEDLREAVGWDRTEHTYEQILARHYAYYTVRDERNRLKFNPPALRGVGQRERFFHDGRADSLEEVFRTHRHQLDEGANDRELDDLIQFLRSL